jgi:DNA primase small subunit
MQDPTQAFIIRAFRRYYSKEPVEIPDRLSRREFGFMFFDRGFVLRHIGFKTKAELKSYMAENVPAHVYHSSAYYENPNAPTMAEKKWMGADLVFDLDADHLKNAEELTYPDMLEQVKVQIKRLLDEFITGDLGFDPDKLKIVFSGGRGYHVHVLDPRALGLGSHERREIVDYITGTDLNQDWIILKRVFETKQYGDIITPLYMYEAPTKRSGGWKKRVITNLPKIIRHLESIGEEAAVEKFSGIVDLNGKKISEKRMREFYSELFGKRGSTSAAERIISEEKVEVFQHDALVNSLLSIIRHTTKIDLPGETDEPVTSDIKRLIRLPSSLHGKTGLRVTAMTRDGLDEFDPLRDAVPKMLTEKVVKMTVKKPVDIELRGERIMMAEGDAEVPEFAALFLACRKMGEIRQ